MRRLSTAERAFLARYFGATLASERIWIGVSLGRRSWSPWGGRISLERALFSGGDPRAEVRLDDARAASIFAHEAMHVWQRQRGRRVSWEGAWLQTGYALGRFDPYAYDRSISNPADLLALFVLGNIEQQGRMVQDFVFAERTSGDVARFAKLAEWIRIVK